MQPQHGVLNVLQGVVYAVLGLYFEQRWFPGTVLLFLAAFGQVTSGLMLLFGKKKRDVAVRLVALFSLGTVALLIGLHLQVAVHIIQTFTPIGAETGWTMIGSIGALLPWVLFLPIWQFIKTSQTGWKTGIQSSLLFLLILLPPAYTAAQGSAQTRYAPIQGEAVSEWIWTTWHGETTATPTQNTPVEIIRSHIRAGKVIDVHFTRSERLEDALPELIPSTPPLAGDALLIEAVVAEGKIHRPVLSQNHIGFQPGLQSLRTAKGPQSLRRWLNSPNIKKGQLLPNLWLPVLSPSDDVQGWTQQEAWLVNRHGAISLERGWTSPEALDIETLEKAILEAANHLRFHMRPNGQFAYVVKGPSGLPGGGYNFPRHAGATWFMAAVGLQNQQPRLQKAALSAAGFLKNNTTFLDDGRAYVLDPARKDGKAWVGTTALALLGLIDGELYPTLQKAYAKHLASAVDDNGKVLGDFDIGQKHFPTQPAVTYAQGQVLLALAAADTANIPGTHEAFQRAAAYVDNAYWPQPAVRMGTLDEHWMCIAADRIDRHNPQASGRAVCEAYLANESDLKHDSPLAIPAGPGGGIAEAWMAAALMDARRGIFTRNYRQAIAYGRLLMAQRYQTGDAPLLERPDALIGGFRDNPWTLDVRMDAVQHIAFALVGLRELLELKQQFDSEST